MIRITALKTLRPSPEYVSKVASVPYDVVNREEAASVAEGNPHSFLRVVRSEIELSSDIDSYDSSVYQRAKDNIARFLADGILIEDKQDSLFLYSIEVKGHRQTGIVAGSWLEDLETGKLKIHEKTRPDKENDRTQHIIRTGTQTGPLFLTYRETGDIRDLVEKELRESSPIYDFVTEDGIQHKVWKLRDSEPLIQAFSNVQASYVADGHHRLASAKRAREEFQKNNSGHNGNEPYNYVLTVLFPDEQLKILAYNRVIHKVEKSLEQIKEELKNEFEFSENVNPKPSSKGEFTMYLAGKWYGLKQKQANSSSDPREKLDVNTLHERILKPVFGVEDPRTDKNIDYIGGVRGTEELERLVDSGMSECAFSLYPVAVNELLEVADAGLTMPPKSTWFEPKLRSGLFIHPIV